LIQSLFTCTRLIVSLNISFLLFFSLSSLSFPLSDGLVYHIVPVFSVFRAHHCNFLNTPG
ncbi:uncharacterized protein EV420DRAFT_1760043, partial [Desarmillaria tabescens]